MKRPGMMRQIFNFIKRHPERVQKKWHPHPYIMDPAPNDDFCDYWARVIDDSPNASVCSEIRSDFIMGTGITRESLANRKIGDDTLKSLIDKVLPDFALYERFAIGLQLNRAGRPIKAWHIPASYVRYAFPGDDMKIKGAMVMPFVNTTEDRANYADLYPLYEPGITKGAKLREDQAWVENEQKKEYKGHIYFVNMTRPGREIYSRPRAVSCQMDAIADARNSEGIERLTANGFMLSGILEIEGDPTANVYGDGDEDKFLSRGELWEEQMREFAGSKAQGSVMTVWKHGAESAVEWIPFQPPNLHETMKETEAILATRIAMAFKVPVFLIPRPQPSGLGDGNRIRQSIILMNETTKKTRDFFISKIRALLEQIPGINANAFDLGTIQDFTDLPEYIFQALSPSQKEDYLEKQFLIEPDPTVNPEPNTQDDEPIDS